MYGNLFLTLLLFIRLCRLTFEDTILTILCNIVLYDSLEQKNFCQIFANKCKNRKNTHARTQRRLRYQKGTMWHFILQSAALDLPVTSLLWSSSHHSANRSNPESRQSEGASKAHFIICQEKKKVQYVLKLWNYFPLAHNLKWNACRHFPLRFMSTFGKYSLMNELLFNVPICIIKHV